MTWRIALLTALAMIAFAANSVLCRMALKAELIDPAAFTQIRIAAGALALAPVLIARGRAGRLPDLKRWAPALALFVYALGFSLAYVAVSAGAGALILFGAVQITMIGLGVIAGAHPSRLEWAGLAAAFSGLAYLASPGLAAPPLGAAALMATAGAAWGVYSVLGKAETDPVGATARNFALAVPFAALLTLAGPHWGEAAPAGIALAAASGALTSGLGYVIWYAALKGLTHAAASIVQLSVPILAALGGVGLLGEPLTPRLAIATALVLGGVLLALQARRKPARPSA